MSITTTEIPRQKWLQYFNDIGKRYTGWNTTVEVLAGELGDQPEAEGLPLQGLSYDPSGSQAGDVMVEVGDAGFPYETHLIRHPRAVRAASSAPSLELDIEIEGEDGLKTLVRLRPRPELPPPGRTAM
jgi:hypothetical protein